MVGGPSVRDSGVAGLIYHDKDQRKLREASLEHADKRVPELALTPGARARPRPAAWNMIDYPPSGSPPLTCEVITGDLLDTHVEEFRSWVSLLWDLTLEALVQSGSVEADGDVFDKALWEGVVGTGMPPEVKDRTRRLSVRAWGDMLGSADLRGFGFHLRPLPHVPEPIGSDSMISLASNWYPHATVPNWVSWSLPARYTVGTDAAWVSRLVDGLVRFGRATCAQVAVLGWMKSQAFTGYPGWRDGFSDRLWLPGWAMLLGEGHMERLGGLSALEGTGAFDRVESVGQGHYYVQARGNLLDIETASSLEETKAALERILLSPPIDPAAALDSAAGRHPGGP